MEPGAGGGWSPAPGAGTSRVAMSAPASTSSSSAPIVATTWRSPSGRFLGPGAMREPTTYDTIMGATDIRRIICMP